MKSTEQFKETITQYIAMRAVKDDLFAKNLNKEGKNIDDCITYILNTVKSTGCVAFTDDEIYGMAVHYYDEDNVKVGSRVSCKIIHTKPEAEPDDTEDPSDIDEPDEIDDADDADDIDEPDDTDDTDEIEIPNRPLSRDSNQLSIF